MLTLTIHYARLRRRCLWFTMAPTALAFLAGFTVAQAADVWLAWNASVSAGVTGYQIHHGPASGTYETVINVGNVTSATITNLTAGFVYYFAVRAYNDTGAMSAFSNELAWTIVPPAPAPPSNLRVIAGTAPLRMTLRWQQPSSELPVLAHVLYKSAPGDTPAWVPLRIIAAAPGKVLRATDLAGFSGDNWCYKMHSLAAGNVLSAEASNTACAILP